MRLLSLSAAIALSTLFAPTAFAQQLISDYKVGKIMGEIQCGKRTMNNGLDYLNNMGVSVRKVQNIRSNPDMLKGLRHAAAFC